MEENLKSIIKNIADLSDMPDLELYRNEFNSKESMFELFFDNYFRKVEGLVCSHDKSVYVSRKINKYLLTGENEILQQTYEEYQEKGGDIGGITDLDKICYWCPTTIKDSKEATSIIFHYLCMDSNFFKNRLGDDKNARNR